MAGIIITAPFAQGCSVMRYGQLPNHWSQPEDFAYFMEDQQCGRDVANLNRIQMWLKFKLAELGVFEFDPDFNQG